MTWADVLPPGTGRAGMWHQKKVPVVIALIVVAVVAVVVAVDDEARSTSTLPTDSSASPASVYKIFWVPPNPERAKA